MSSRTHWNRKSGQGMAARVNEAIGVSSALVPEWQYTPSCVACRYNLTGIDSARCPECGWFIDWRLAMLPEEERRIGTPAYKARGWRVLPAALRTVCLMLFRPARFARRLRHDEPWRAAMLIAFLAYCAAILPAFIKGPREAFHEDRIRELSGAVSCMAVIVMSLGLLSWMRNPALALARRLRLFTILAIRRTGTHYNEAVFTNSQRRRLSQVM